MYEFHKIKCITLTLSIFSLEITIAYTQILFKKWLFFHRCRVLVVLQYSHAVTARRSFSKYAKAYTVDFAQQSPSLSIETLIIECFCKRSISTFIIPCLPAPTSPRIVKTSKMNPSSSLISSWLQQIFHHCWHQLFYCQGRKGNQTSWDRFI